MKEPESEVGLNATIKNVHLAAVKIRRQQKGACTVAQQREAFIDGAGSRVVNHLDGGDSLAPARQDSILGVEDELRTSEIGTHGIGHDPRWARRDYKDSPMLRVFAPRENFCCRSHRKALTFRRYCLQSRMVDLEGEQSPTDLTIESQYERQYRPCRPRDWSDYSPTAGLAKRWQSGRGSKAVDTFSSCSPVSSGYWR